MKKSLILFLHFVSLLDGLLSSDPDSVAVQSSEDNTENHDRKTQTGNSRDKVFISETEPGVFVRTYMRRVTFGSQTFWLEISKETLDLKLDSIPFENGWKNLRTVPPNSRITTEKSIINVSSVPTVDKKSQMPPNRNIVSIHGKRKTVNSSPVTTESHEEDTEDENPETEITKSPERIPPDSQFFAGIVNDFAFKLVKTLDSKSNLVISPLSIFVALSMCYLGADGHTKVQMEKVLGMDDNAIHGERFHQGISDLLSILLKDSGSYKLNSANGMFLGQNFTVDAQFVKNVRRYYDADLKNLDFGNSQESLRVINGWVAQNTNGMIGKIINSQPHPLTKLILLNAVYFEGSWDVKFPQLNTYPRYFYSTNRRKKEVRFMMLRDETFPLYRSDEYNHTFIKLPYDGEQISMIIALPYTKEQEPMPSITDEILCRIRDAMDDTEISTIAIPKCRLEYRKPLIYPLLKLGMHDLFDQNAVNLSKLRKANDVFVSAIVHKAVVEINEEGTRASAVSSIKLTPLSAAMKSTTFIADHPFAFYIVHEESGLVLFHGKVFDFDTVAKGN